MVSGTLNITSNAAAVLRGVRTEQSAFRRDVESTSKALQKTWGQKWSAKVETSAAGRAMDTLKRKLEPLRKKVVTAMAVKDAATKKVQSVVNKVKAVGKMVVAPLVKLKDKVSAGISKVAGKLKSLAKSVVIPVSIAGAAVIGGAINEGAKLEQSIGGVETMFKGDAGIVKANADNAAQTAGLSANDYMETVTGFSASLLNSMDGDTGGAAAVADMAVIDMADNANKFGTDMESIQNAYQGFAKQNYTMLDNLKLGYGGTKEEMARLLSDASELTGVEYDMDNLADVYSAIHAIQDDLGVTGTTAAEASQTFSGSFAAMKASAQNLLGNLAIGGDVTGSMEQLVDSASTFLFNNALPMIGRIVTALPGALKTAIAKAGPVIMEEGGNIIQALREGMVNMLPSSMGGIVDTLFDGIGSTFSEASGAFTDAMPAFQDMGSSLFSGLQTSLDAIMPVISSGVGAIINVMGAAAPVVTGIIDIISGAISTLAPVVSTIFNGIAAKTSTVASFLGDNMGFLKDVFSSAFSGIANVLTTAWAVVGPIFDVAISIFKLLFRVVQAVFPAIKAIVSGVWNFLKPIFEGLGGALSAVADGVGWLADKVGGWLGIGGDEEVASPAAEAASTSSQVEESAVSTVSSPAAEAGGVGNDGPSGDDDDPINVDVNFDDLDLGDLDWPDDGGGSDSGGGMAIPQASEGLPAATPAAAMGEPQTVEQHIDQSVTVTLSSLAGSITIKEEVDIDSVAARVVDQVVTAIQNTQAVPTPA